MRLRPNASSSSMKMIQGAARRACSNRSRTRAAPTPTNISTNSDTEREKKDTPASPATAREQRLAGARWADQQHALGNARPEAPERFRVAQKGHDLLKLVFRLVHARNVAERHLGVGFDINLGARFSDCHQAAKALALGHAANGIHPDQVKDEDRQN